jgi:DNA/RNA endonuclease YhcR with UshA esterase domain
MFNPNQSSLCASLKMAATCLLVFGLCALSSAQAQHAATKTPELKYDLKTEKKVKGIVQEMKQVGQGHAALMHLVIKTGTETVEVYLCPQHFIKDMGIELKAGDEVEITGSPVLDNGVSVILAREIDKGTDSYVLRDDKGLPVWNWQHT